MAARSAPVSPASDVPGDVTLVPGLPPEPAGLAPAKVKSALKNAALRAQNNIMTLTHRENLTMLAQELFGKDSTIERL